MGKRSYGQFCALARALDAVGERWTLLLVRDLMTGPRRFSDLLEGLPGLGPSLLSDRLKQLEAEQIVRRSKMAPPAASTVYELTDLGAALAPAVLELANWGVRLLDEVRPDDVFNPVWLGLYVQAAVDPERARGVHETYEFSVDGQVFHFRVDDGDVEARQGPAQSPDLRVTTDLKTFMDVGLGRIDPTDAIAAGRSTIEGDPDTLLRALRILTPPVVDELRGATVTA